MDDDANLPAQWAKEDTSHLEGSGFIGDPDDFSQPFMIYADRRKAIKKLNQRMMFAAPLILIYSYCVSSMYMWFLAALLIVQMALMYLWVVRKFNKNVTPLMQLDDTGITIHGLITHLHMSWDNLKEVRAYSFGYKYVGMNAKNVWKLHATVPMKLFLAYSSFVQFFYNLIGIKLCGINVPEQYAHFNAEDICEQVEKRREHYLGLPSHKMALQAQSEPRLSDSQNGATLKLPTNENVKLKQPNSEG
ncbi:MAG: hypothetical protein JST89_10940 [Cyanobacteria bacterium SZAS-4]|nr:hypothetical protein [Cyanobacteria bacterium SZAS-4]